jgi:hypothetical protein
VDDIEDLDFPSPHAHLSRDQLHSAWNAEWARIRAWRYEHDRVWALGANEPDADVIRRRKMELATWILDAIAITLELEDAYVDARKVKPTDVPEPWGQM